MLGGQLFLALAALVCSCLLLTGCGTGGTKGSHAAAEFVSQSVQGVARADIVVNGATMGQLFAHMRVFVDAEALDIRVDAEVNQTGLGKSILYNLSMVFNSSQKRATFLNQGLPTMPTCVYKDFTLPPTRDMVASIKSFLKDRKPTGMDGNYRQFSADVPPMGVASVHFWVDLDDTNGMQKAGFSLGSTAANHTDGTFIASTVEPGKPDASHFEVPDSWGHCQAKPVGVQGAVEELVRADDLFTSLLLGQPAEAEEQALLVV